MKKTLEFVDAMRNAGIPAPFVEALKSGELDADQSIYLSRLICELAAIQAFCKLAGEKLSADDVYSISRFQRWENELMYFAIGSLINAGVYDVPEGVFVEGFVDPESSVYAISLREFKKFLGLAEDDE